MYSPAGPALHSPEAGPAIVSFSARLAASRYRVHVVVSFTNEVATKGQGDARDITDAVATAVAEGRRSMSTLYVPLAAATVIYILMHVGAPLREAIGAVQ